jgi:hypothetical protein
MEFYLQNFNPINRKQLLLSVDEFNAIKQAKEYLGHLLKLTESYRIVFESYRNVELSKFTAELDHLLYGMSDYIDITNTRVFLNSPISGYLSSSRHYLYVIQTTLKYLSLEGFNQYKEVSHRFYDSNLEYRFIEALRNHVQHFQLPIDTIRFHNFKELENYESELVTCISVLASKQNLSKNKDFKKEVLNELPNEIEIVGSIRVHMEGMWHIQKSIHPFLATISKDQRNIINALFDKFEKETGDFSIGLNVIEIGSDGVITNEFNVTTEWEEARLLSLDKLGNLANLRKRYITGKIRKKDK